MKKWSYIIFITCLGLTSCDKENTEELQPEDLLASQEYFRAEINDQAFEVLDPETMGGTIYPSPESGIITFDFYGGIEEGDNYEALDFKICYYDGPGTYYTGTTTSVSWADYYRNWDSWYNDYRLDDPGIVIVEEHTENFISGIFEFNAYNYDDDSFVNVKGEFNVMLEKNVYQE